MQPNTKESSRPFRTFEDLEVYQAAREFRSGMYALAGELPSMEKFALADQVRRAAVSMTNNIAEGHGRYHYLDQIKFCRIARGSVEELIDDLNVCTDESYVPMERIEPLKQQGWRVYQLLNGYIRYLRDRKTGGGSGVAESSTAYLTAEDEADALLTAKRGLPPT